MSQIWWLLLAIAGMVIALRLLGTGKLGSALKQARKTGEVAGVIAAIEGTSEKKHPNMWDQAIGNLWEEYHREEAMDLMIAGARRTDAPIIQFWIKKALEVEPKMAEQQFSEEFLNTYYKPRIANKCGRVSCCM